MSSTRFQNATRLSPTYVTGWSAATGFTVTGWVNPHDAFYTRLVNMIGGSGTQLRLIIFETNKIYLWTDPLAGQSITADTWLFFSITIASNTATLKVSTDYETLSTGYTFAMAEGWSITSIEIGGDTAGENQLTDGQLHHIRIFGSALTDDELIAELTSATAVGNPWAAWELEGTKMEDYSGNEKDLTSLVAGTITIGASSSPPQPNNAATIGSGF